MTNENITEGLTADETAFVNNVLDKLENGFVAVLLQSDDGLHVYGGPAEGASEDDEELVTDLVGRAIESGKIDLFTALFAPTVVLRTPDAFRAFIAESKQAD